MANLLLGEGGQAAMDYGQNNGTQPSGMAQMADSGVGNAWSEEKQQHRHPMLGEDKHKEQEEGRAKHVVPAEEVPSLLHSPTDSSGRHSMLGREELERQRVGHNLI
jgi:hypothetical protein